MKIGFGQIHNITRKVMVAFMDLFNEIHVKKYAEDGSVRKIVRVPIHYANKDKYLGIIRSSNLATDLNTNPARVEFEWILPRMACQVVSLTYTPERHTSKMNRIVVDTPAPSAMGNRIRKNIYSPVPYTMDMEMTVVTKTMNDAFQVMEQVLPFFSPSLSVNINLVDGMPSESVPFVLSSVTPNIADELMPEEDRLITIDFSFQAKFNYYVPVYDSKPIYTVIDKFCVDDPTYQKFVQYTQTAVNKLPMYDPDYRLDEPYVLTISESDGGIVTQVGESRVINSPATVIPSSGGDRDGGGA